MQYTGDRLERRSGVWVLGEVKRSELREMDDGKALVEGRAGTVMLDSSLKSMRRGPPVEEERDFVGE